MRVRFDHYPDLIRQRATIQRHADDAKTFEQRVVNVRRGFQQLVEQMAQQGIDQASIPRKLAREIRNFVVMTPKNPASESHRQAAG